MPLVASNKGHAEPIEEGNYQAVCYSIIDLGTQHWVYQGKPNKGHKVQITWEIPELRVKWEKDGQKLEGPKVIGKEYLVSLGKKANLLKDLVSWRGKAFTPEELKGFDISKLLGANCLLQIVHNDKGYATISAISNLVKGMKVLKPENPVVKFEITDSTTSIPAEIPNWLAEKIKKSDEFIKNISGDQNPASNPVISDDCPPPTDDDVFRDAGNNDDIPF